MGQVNTRIKVANWFDLEKVALGERSEPAHGGGGGAGGYRGGALYLRASLVKQLGLRPIRKVTSRTMADVSVERTVFSPVDLEIQGRAGTFEVIEVPDTLPNIVGQIPLEQLDWVVDPGGRRPSRIPSTSTASCAMTFSRCSQTVSAPTKTTNE